MDLLTAAHDRRCAHFTDEPVRDAVVRAILDDARFAPSGGNRQPWRVAVVKDLASAGGSADLMQLVWDEYVARRQPARRRSTSSSTSSRDDVPHAPNPLLDGIETVPVVLVIAADLDASP